MKTRKDIVSTMLEIAEVFEMQTEVVLSFANELQSQQSGFDEDFEAAATGALIEWDLPTDAEVAKDFIRKCEVSGFAEATVKHGRYTSRPACGHVAQHFGMDEVLSLLNEYEGFGADAMLGAMIAGEDPVEAFWAYAEESGASKEPWFQAV